MTESIKRLRSVGPPATESSSSASWCLGAKSQGMPGRTFAFFATSVIFSPVINRSFRTDRTARAGASKEPFSWCNDERMSVVSTLMARSRSCRGGSHGDLCA